METFNKPVQNLRTTMKPLLKKQSQVFTWLIMTLAFITPLFFLPLTTEFYVFNKITLLYFFIFSLLIIWAIRIFFEQKFKLVRVGLNLPVLSLMIVYLVSTFVQAPNKIASLNGETGLIICLGLLYFVIVNHFKGRKPVTITMISLLVSSVVLAWLTIFSYLEVFAKFGPDWLQNKTWTPTGSPLITASLMLTLLPGTLYWAFKSKGATEKILLFLASSLQFLSLILLTALFVDKTLVLSYLMPHFGWQIAVEGLKNFRTALLGVGPGNFLSAFNRFRPIALNNTSIWAVKFTANSNQYLNLLSTVGILGLLSYCWLVWKSLKRENFKGSLIGKVLYICLATSFIVQLVFNANLLILFLIFLMLGLLQANKMPAETDMGYEHKAESQGIVWGVAGGITVLALLVFYCQSRVWLADYYFRQSLLAAQANRGADTYNLQIKAIKLNPYNENYRISYANTNFALANSLAGQADLTDQERANINQLISQAIREAKAATALNPQISGHWVNLASIYRNIINVAEEAEQWAASAYLEAVRTDSTNPLLRVDFGSLFFALQNYDQAIMQFTQSVNLKPDYANGYYNLAAAYQGKEDWVNAFISMQSVIGLIPIDSPDYQKASEELEALRSQLPEEVQVATAAAEIKEEEKLTPPEELPSPQPGMEEVELPEEVGPEVPEKVEPEATEEATSGATP